MKKCLMFFLGILINVQIVIATEKAQRWEQGLITLDFYKKLITVENCESSLQRFTGCIASLTVMLNASLGYKGNDRGMVLDGTDVLSESEPQSNQKAFSYLIYRERLAKQNVDLEEANQVDKNKLEATRIQRLRAFYSDLYKLALRAKEKPYGSLIKSLEDAARKPIPAHIIAAAINSYLSKAVDPHTMIIPEKTFIEEMTQKEEISSGIGISYRVSKGSDGEIGLRLIGTFDHSPARKAGLKKRDLITHVNSLKITDDNLDKMMNLLIDPDRKELAITIDRSGNGYTFNITKQSYEIENVSESIIEFKGKNIGYAKLNQFQMTVNENGFPKDCADLSETFSRFQKYAHGAILDLRSNGGGSVNTAVCIAAIFLGGGVRVATAKKIEHQIFPKEMMSLFSVSDEGATASPETTFFDTPARLQMVYDKPLVILVNENSASSSELLAAALRDHNRAYIVGNKTFGKGTTMSPVAKTKEPDLVAKDTEFTQNRSESIPEKRLMILGTDSRFYSPKGISHHGLGLTPHLIAFMELQPSPNELAKQREADRFLYPLAATPLADYTNFKTSHMNQLVSDFECINDAKVSDYFLQLDDSAEEKDMQILKGAQQIACMYINIPEKAYPRFVLQR